MGSVAAIGGGIFGGGGGGLTQPSVNVVQPATPSIPGPTPSTAEAIQEYVKAQPQLLQQQLEIAPKEAQQQLDLLRQYGQPFAEEARRIQSTLTPETVALQEQLARDVQAGINDPFSEAEKRAIISDLNAQLGRNVEAGSGDVFRAKAFAGERFARQQNFRNLGLALIGSQPVPQPQLPSTTQFVGSLTPGQVLSGNLSSYATRAGVVPQPQVNFGPSKLTQFGQVLGGLGQIGSSAAMMCWVAAEVFEGSWADERTKCARRYITEKAPRWFKNAYLRFGERVANFISNRKTCRDLLRPMFILFARLGGYNA